MLDSETCFTFNVNLVQDIVRTYFHIRINVFIALIMSHIESSYVAFELLTCKDAFLSTLFWKLI